MGAFWSGFELRPALIRLYQGIQSGDRPKNAEEQFPELCATPKGPDKQGILFRRRISVRNGQMTIAWHFNTVSNVTFE